MYTYMYISLSIYMVQGPGSVDPSLVQGSNISMDVSLDISVDISVDISMDIPMDVSMACLLYTSPSPRD